MSTASAVETQPRPVPISTTRRAHGLVVPATLLAIADTHAQGRLVSCLEGGYHLEALAESVQAHLEVLLQGNK